MKVALDARWAQHQPLGGVGRGVAMTLAPLARLVDLTALTDSDHPPLPGNVRQKALPTPPPGLATGWLQYSAPRWLRGFDGLFHCPWYGLPYWQPVPMVATLHDLTFEHHSDWFSPSRRLSYRAQARHAARSARIIIVPSATVHRDVVSTYSLAPERVVIVPQAIDPIFGAPTDPAAQAVGSGEPYLVALGGHVRRRLPVAVAAWRHLRESFPHLGLVVVGEPQPSPTEAGLTYAGKLDDYTWSALLRGATALLYPTAYEGFGMPALEAAAGGTAVVAGPVGALPEVLGDAAQWADGDSPANFARATARLLTDIGRLQHVRELGLARARAWPTWEDVARRTADAYATAG